MATPASASPATTSVSIQPTSSQSRTVTPAEVGWQFVPQYYTFVNKQPHKLHCFYNRNSTFTHGTEGEDVKHLSGQAQIHEKIVSLGFQDCKVYINSVDAQASISGGIIIQVIGEMSNRGEAWRKFAQTFFLAEQPNGYYVLNDIFRFLKEETLADSASQEEELAEGEPDGVVPVEVHPEPVEATTVNGYHPELEKSAPVAPEPEPIVAAEEHPSQVEDVVPPQPDHPGISTVVDPPAPALPHVEEPAVPEPEPVQEEEKEEPAPAPPVSVPAAPQEAPAKVDDVKPPMPNQPPTSTVTAPAPAPAATPSPAAAPAAAAATPAPPAPAPAPGPKTWANLAAKDSNRWGANVASEARGVSAAPPPVKAAAPVTIPSSAVGPAGLSGPGTPGSQASRDRSIAGDRGMHPNAVAAMGVTTGQCFVKGVTENVSTTALRETLTNRFGAIKELEIVRSKACAFLEFVQADGARKAILASLPMSQGGDGGIRIPGADGAEGGRINVEMRKERGERPTSNPRGGARGGVPGGGAGEGRGSFRGRGGGERGAPPPTGGAGRGERGRGRGAAPQQK